MRRQPRKFRRTAKRAGAKVTALSFAEIDKFKNLPKQ
jgi:hypothetical protein